MEMLKIHAALCFLTAFFVCANSFGAGCGTAWGCRAVCPHGGQAVQVDYTYTGGVFGNVSGGKTNRSTYMGLAELEFTADTEKLGLWKNGTFFVGSFFSHGKCITEYVGDYQDPVNFAYNTPAQVAEYWYMHSFLRDRFTVKVGKQDACATFFYLDSREDFMNDAFGCPPSSRLRSQPDTAWGITSSVELSSGIVLKAGIQDAEGNANTFWMSELKHFYYAAQIEKQYTFGTLPGFAFLGGWYDSSEIDRHRHGQSHPAKRDYGLNLGLEQMVWKGCYCPSLKRSLRDVTFSSQFGAFRKDRNDLSRYWNIGLTCNGLLAFRPDDVVGIGCSTVRFSPQFRAAEELRHGYESAFECFCKIHVT